MAESIEGSPNSSSDAGGLSNVEDGVGVTVRTAQGEIRGKWLGGVARFAGIPFAEPPVGDLRFRPPLAPQPWDGVRDATAFGAICPQNPSMMDLLFGGESEVWNEDCLYLNVWSSEVPDSPVGDVAQDLRPVMVWIHGGGFEMGSGSSPLYRGDSFARDGVVFVTINYRLGSLGFLELGGLDPAERGSANVGLLDQIAALEWVRDNIAQFGGDPSSVTIFGESAGAMSVSLLLASPLAQGLFKRAITQSGAASAYREVNDADADTAEFLEILGMGSVDELRAAPVETLLKAHAELGAKRTSDPATTIRTHGNPLAFLAFRPVAEGRVVPLDPLESIRRGSAADVALMSGTNLEEWKLFSIGAKPVESEEVLIRRFGNLVEDPHSALDAYRRENPEASLADIECAFMTDVVFRIPADRLAEAQLQAIDSHRLETEGAPAGDAASGTAVTGGSSGSGGARPAVYQYRFDWRSQAMGGLIGAAHAVEIPFVFDLLGDQRLHVLLGVDAPNSLSAKMHHAWVAFASTGDPTGDPTGARSSEVGDGPSSETGDTSGRSTGPSSDSGHDWVPSSQGARVVQILDSTSMVVKDPNPIVTEFWSS
ncbi:MAG TPA: carboxylesterase/lipase family protein [Microthrixaceae bacterium]|nr:carboxylesterase/lipase family protein [Microthrixaceae bacterium]